MPDKNEILRALPAVQDVLGDAGLAGAQAGLPRPLVVRAVQEEIAAVRQRVLASANGSAPTAEELAAEVTARVRERLERERAPGPRRVINATGVIVHTNLGRAPLAEEAIEHVREVARGYSDLEYDLVEGGRGSRHAHVERELADAVGAEAAFAVNNNAAAVMLALAALAGGREVVVSRGELVEIGGSFRVPDILRASGARLAEVGTTNRTHARDVERAIGPDTAMLLKVHTSNFRVVGFTAEVEPARMGEIARAAGIPFVWDLGSGMVVEVAPAHSGETSPRRALEHADLVTFSGDKLLGGPQAGVIAGRAALVEKLRSHPLARAFRADKLSLAALTSTVRLAMDPALAERIPVVRMCREPVDSVRARATQLRDRIIVFVEDLALDETSAREITRGLAVVDAEATFGGGSVPGQSLASAAVRLAPPSVEAGALERALRQGRPPVIARIRDGAVFLDARTVASGEVDETARVVAGALEAALRPDRRG